jgi:phage shock protein C
MPENRLTRSESDKILAGVCGGIAVYLGIDSLLVRLAFVVLLFASGIGFPIYLILWIIMPREADIHKTGSQVIQKNIGEMSDTVSSSMNRVGRPGTIGVLLILLGIYFLLDQLGWMHWANGIFWPLVFIGAGVYMMARRR